MKEIHYRVFYPQDLDQCLAIFEGNCPEFFAIPEQKQFAQYLGKEKLPYFVLIDPDEKIVACGGFVVESNIAELAWGMVERNRHGQGLGTLLFNFRLVEIRKAKAVALKMDTNQHSLGFYLRLGFKIQSKIPNGYAEGLDRFDLLLDLS